MPIATVAIAANCYLAYNSDGATRTLYASAAGLVFASLPLTKFGMMPGISRLIDIGRSAALQGKGGVDAEVAVLLKSWVKQNYFRRSLHLTAGLLGLFAALSGNCMHSGCLLPILALVSKYARLALLDILSSCLKGSHESPQAIERCSVTV